MQLDLLTSLSRLAITAAETPADGDEIKLDLLTALYVFMLAAFIGFEVIRRISPLLHTPLMSLTNALDAIAVVGAIVLADPTPTAAWRPFWARSRSSPLPVTSSAGSSSPTACSRCSNRAAQESHHRHDP